MHSPLLLAVSDTTLAAIAAAVVAIAVPVNTALLIVLNSRQKKGNHHLESIAARDETIRELRHDAAAVRGGRRATDPDMDDAQ